MYKPLSPFSTPLILLIPTVSEVMGVKKPTFPSIDNGILIFGSFKTFGGTEHDVNGLLSVEDTAVVETWFRPDIQSNCRIAVAGTTAVYEIKGTPENIEMRNQYLKFKISRIKGGA